MCKSSHKSQKRRRSPSRDRLAGLENTLTRLLDVLQHQEVMAPRCPSPPAPLLDSPNQHETLEIQQETTSDTDSPLGNVPCLDHSVPSGSSMAVPARQERPIECNSGVYVLSGPIFAEYRKNRHSLANNNPPCLPGATNKGNVSFESPSVTEAILADTPSLATTLVDEDTLTRELFASALEKVEVSP
ncbi:hypothetical protein X777_10503 [Ooceraea biroi]|uniref:Uncharacterized protein n=1 Tax=Ooceraea biroi TaxID=2015173 RepID=A0A026X106_OOCBI|nr:hypothetical protein X777_10503 [Ooceraea biroi]